MHDKHRGGFTLTEVIISILIVSAAFAGLALAFSTGLMAIKATRETSIAIQAAQQEIENMRNTPFDAIQTHSFSIPSLSTNGTFVVEPMDSDMKKASISISWISGSSRSISKEFVTMMTRHGINRK